MNTWDTELEKVASVEKESKGETFKCPTCDSKVLEQTKYCLKCKKKVKASLELAAVKNANLDKEAKSIMLTPWEKQMLRSSLAEVVKSRKLKDNEKELVDALEQKLKSA